jgi:DNA-binding response OmpR family regulator
MMSTSLQAAHDHDRQVLRAGTLTLDRAQWRLFVGQREVALTRTEFELIETLMEQPGRTFTRLELIERAFQYEYEGVERSLDTHIKNLRRKMGDTSRNPAFIATVYGVGYRLKPQSAPLPKWRTPGR